MAINRKMRRYLLQKNIPEQSTSGVKRDHWCDIGEIEAAVYKKNDMQVLSSEKYNESTHIGLTYQKQMSQGKYRLVSGERIYRIIGCNTDSRLTNLLLKVVETDAG